jgi:plastocyanin
MTVGTVIGTPGYAPPEQYQGLATPESDVYALGATLHRLLTGFDPEHGTPFCYPSICALNPLVSRELAGLVEKAIKLDPSQRYATADQFADALLDLAWERGQTGAPGAGTQANHRFHGPSRRSQQAFRWTALVVCLMMVAPGVFSVLAGASVSPSGTTPTLTDYACPPALSDGAGGPYPAQNTSVCLGQPQVVIQVVQDPAQVVGFAPSNVTVSTGTALRVAPNDLGCTVRWLQSMGIQAVTGQLTQPGTYRFACQEYPNVVGLVHVQ